MRVTFPGVTIKDIWDAQVALYGVAGSYGALLETNLDAKISDAVDATAVLESRLTAARAALLDNLVALDPASRLNFYDDFNRTAEDTDVWTSGGEAGGSFTASVLDNDPTAWKLVTGTAVNDDYYIHSGLVVKGKYFTPFEDGYTTVTFEARIKLSSLADISALLGLYRAAQTDYTQYPAACVQFLIDPVISATFRARSYEAAEEETDTLVALDTEWHKLKIVWTRTSVAFYVDDVLKATHSAQVPSYPALAELLVRTEVTAAKTMYIDKVSVEVS